MMPIVTELTSYTAAANEHLKLSAVQDVLHDQMMDVQIHSKRIRSGTNSDFTSIV